MDCIAIIDDNEVDREAVRRLVGQSFEIVEASTAQEGLRICRERKPVCVLLDYRLPDASGVDIVADLAAAGLPVVMLSGQGDQSVAVSALKGGAQDYLAKRGLTAEKLRHSMRSAIETVALQAALVRSEARLRLVLQQLPAAVWTTDDSLRITSLSGRDLTQLGLSDAHGQLVGTDAAGPLATARDVHVEALSGRAATADLRHGARHYHASVQRLDGPRPGTIGILLDTTDQHRLQDQLRQSQKLEALGRLAGGIAHDFNNLLTVVLSCATVATESIPADSPAQADLNDVIGAGNRAAELTRQLLAFSRTGPPTATVIDVGPVLVGLGRMLQRLLGERIALDTWVAPNLPRVRIEAGLLEQVIVNLAVNARDAMPAGGRLVIEAVRITVDSGWSDFRGEVIPPGPYVRIVVNDTGSGIAPDVRAHMFEPFFTTKEAGTGTGLGLATVFGIVSQAGGALHVYTERGRGTAFHIYLPATFGAPSAEASHMSERPRGTESVLLVEDDPRIRHVTARILVECGYSVTIAASGEEAMNVLLGPDHFDLLLSDVVMAGIDGYELCRRALTMRPELRVSLTSGYSPRIRSAAEARWPLLQKPFTPDSLATSVRTVLDGPPMRP